MQHPFAGVLEGEQGSPASTVKSAEPATSRRGLLAILLGIVAAGTSGVLTRSEARAQQPTTLAVGEEGGRRPTTYAVGEEGGRRMTTYAAHEEGGHHRRTTYAVGEEGGHRRVTTYAVGEEGGYPPVRTRG